MDAAEAKLSFDLAVDSVLDSLERKFILKEEQRLALHSFITTKKDVLAFTCFQQDFCRFTYVIWYNWYDWLRAMNRRLW